MNRCQPLALGVAIGVLLAAYVFFAGILAIFDWGSALVQVLGSLYLGYEASVLGALAGAAWGFLDGFIAGVVIAWLYNLTAKQ